MKIEGPSKTGGTKGASKSGAKKGVSGSSFGAMVDTTAGVSGNAPASGAVSVNNIEALLSIQEAGDGTTGGGKQPRERAGALLDELEKLRIGLLTGSVPLVTLNRLAHLVGTRREQVMDPALGQILDEIDLRVQVELAKHRTI